MLFDSHLHTRFSTDSEMTASAALEAAARQRVGLVFTEHLDFSYPGDKQFVFDPRKYWQAYEPLRGENLSLGVEAGLVPGETEQVEAFIDAVPFDEVIGSIHLVDGQDLYEKSCYEGQEQTVMYSHYFTLMAAMVRENSFIDVLGHIDYIARYAPYEEPGVRYERWPDEIDDVLRAVVATDTILELNTRRMGEQKARQELATIFRRYRELGGRMVTIGSDAHAPENIAAHFSLAQDFVDALNLEVVSFQNRRAVKAS